MCCATLKRANVDLKLVLKNQDGDLINDATFTGYEIVVTQGGANARVSNSDDSAMMLMWQVAEI
jgi:hypothetical protein